MTDLAIVVAADQDYCFDCGRKSDDACGVCRLLLESMAKGTPSGISDRISRLLMGRPTTARARMADCRLCRGTIRKGEKGRNVQLPDNSRAFVHEVCIWTATEPFEAPEECKHGIFPESACTLCNGRETSVSHLSRAFRARRGGICIVCEAPFQAGETIAKLKARGQRGWGHASHE